MSFKTGDYTDITFLGTTGQTQKSVFTLGSTSADANVIKNVLVYDITVSNQTGTGGEVRIYSDIGTAGSDVYVYCSANDTVNVSKQVPFRWNLKGSTGFKNNIYASSFAGAGVRTYIGAILQ